jgi:large subunit ribosomal protein L31
MKEGIHPEYHAEAQVVCACGNSWSVGATVPVIRTDVCNKCHPFFTGEQRIVDSGGQVERFMKKLQRRDTIIAQEEERKALATSPQLDMVDLGLDTRTEKVLAGAGLTTVGQLLDKLAEGDVGLTNLKGFGLKSLATLKKTLRSRGFTLPGDEPAEVAEEAEPEEDEAAE